MLLKMVDYWRLDLHSKKVTTSSIAIDFSKALDSICHNLLVLVFLFPVCLVSLLRVVLFHPYVFVCYPYICCSYVLVCDPYVTRMYPYVLVCCSYVLVWCFSHDPKHALSLITNYRIDHIIKIFHQENSIMSVPFSQNYFLLSGM